MDDSFSDDCARRHKRKRTDEVHSLELSEQTMAVLSDTHGVLDDSVLAAIKTLGPAHTVHGGDLGDVKKKSRLSGTAVLNALRAASPGGDQCPKR